MKTSKKNRKKNLLERAFWGLFFTLSAICLLLGSLGIVTFGVNVWLVILGIFASVITIYSLIKFEWFGVFLPVAFIATIFNSEIVSWLGLESLHVGAVWVAAAFLSVGFSILFHKKHNFYFSVKSDFKRDKCIDGESVDESVDSADKTAVEVRTKFGETVKYIESDNLKKVFLDCSFGAQKIYFDNATPNAKGVDLQVSCSFSGIELYVPKNWNIINGANCFAAGISEKNRAILTDKSPELRLSGTLNLSGVEIIYI